ncbi:MAG: phosphatidate cytidylyltransferase [Saprospiraceae bacterium]
MNRNELLTRSLTGLFIVGITMAAVIFSPYTYLVWLAFITFFGCREFLNLEQVSPGICKSIIVPLIASAWILGTGYLMMHSINVWFMVAVIPFSVTCILLFQIFSRRAPELMVKDGKSYFTAAIYIGIPMVSGCLFLLPQYSFQFVLVPIFLIWANDVFAYLIGSKWGTKKIAPLISPGKSIQGTVGGGVFTIALSLALLLIWPQLPVGFILTLGISVPVFALGGDLWESALKRTAGVKDSGAILPGHGGILDRYDSLLFVMPLAALAYFIFAL